MYALQHEVLRPQGIPVQGVGRRRIEVRRAAIASGGSACPRTDSSRACSPAPWPSSVIGLSSVARTQGGSRRRPAPAARRRQHRPAAPTGQGGQRCGIAARRDTTRAPTSRRSRPSVPKSAGGRGEDVRTCRPAIGWSSSLADPEIISPAVIEFDGNGRMYVAEFVSYMLDADGNGAARSDQPHHALREHEGRRQVRQAHGLRRQAHPAAHDPAARRTASSSPTKPTRTTS